MLIEGMIEKVALDKTAGFNAKEIDSFNRLPKDLRVSLLKSPALDAYHKFMKSGSKDKEAFKKVIKDRDDHLDSIRKYITNEDSVDGWDDVGRFIKKYKKPLIAAGVLVGTGTGAYLYNKKRKEREEKKAMLIEEMLEKQAFFNNYKDDVDVVNAKNNYNKTLDERKKALNPGNFNEKVRLSKRQYDDSKAKADMDRVSDKPLSKSRLNLEKKYKEKGFSEDEAKLRAFKKDRFNRRLKLGLGAAALAGAGYGAYKYHDYSTDKVIKKGTKLQNIRYGDRQNFDDIFFTSHKKKDNDKYSGLYGNQLKHLRDSGFISPDSSTSINKADLEVTEDIKIPSRKKSKQMFKEIMANNDAGKKSLEELLSDEKDFANNPVPIKRFINLHRASKNLEKGKIDGNVYDAANMNFLKGIRDYSPSYAKNVEKKFYEKLKDEGTTQYKT